MDLQTQLLEKRERELEVTAGNLASANLKIKQLQDRVDELELPLYDLGCCLKHNQTFARRASRMGYPDLTKVCMLAAKTFKSTKTVTS